MHRRIGIMLIVFAATYSGMAQNKYWQQHLNYNIDVSLNDVDHSLTGFIQIDYFNNSPDTLTFIWFHIYPNAYKNDRTAFSDQLIENGSTEFYFSQEKDRGYINQLNFEVNGITALIEDDLKHIDILKVYLPQPLPPHQSAKITTPFHVQLPSHFSRSGHDGQTYQVTQWFPKPAVYDARGWHAMPYLDQGEFYSEFADWKVNITLPDNYWIAASGTCNNVNEVQKIQDVAKQSLNKQENFSWFQQQDEFDIENPTALIPPSSPKTKTLTYTLQQAHDFAWFASKLFLVQYDTVLLKEHAVNVYSFFHPWQVKNWDSSIHFAKDAIHFYSEKLGLYPYDQVSVVAGSEQLGTGGMEYPAVTFVTSYSGGQTLDAIIAHEIGHNWFYGILASNEREHPWMDEGMNTFYQERYEMEKYGRTDNFILNKKGIFKEKLPLDMYGTLLSTYSKLKKDQPIDGNAETYTELNYNLVVYEKAALWMQHLKDSLGDEVFDKSMQAYYNDWKFKHPYPADFKKSIENASETNIEKAYATLFTSGTFNNEKRSLKPTLFFNLKETGKYNYVSFLPVAGYNNYDKIMVGAAVHNYQLPLNKFNFFIAPVYAINSKQLNGVGRLSYNVFKTGTWSEYSLSGAKYSVNEFNDVYNGDLYLQMSRVVPSIKITSYNKDPRSHQKWIFQARSFLLSEDNLRFKETTTPSDTFYSATKISSKTYINELRITTADNRVLYPYNLQLSLQQGDAFLRAGFTGKYFFNYPVIDGKGVEMRFFAGKFFYLRPKNIINQFETQRYHLNLSAPNGYEDYTYSNYFIGRNEFEGWQSQQVIERDGFFKVNTSLLGNKLGRSDNWIAAINFTGDIPEKINPFKVLPINIPVKFFADFGTYAEGWNGSSSNGSLLYDAGLQFSPFNSLINIYFPLLYSKAYCDYYKSYLGQKHFIKTVTFSINIQVITTDKLTTLLPL